MEPPRTPFSQGLKPKSHCATGRMMLIPTASFTTVIMLIPESTDRMSCTFPKPVNWSASSKIEIALGGGENDAHAHRFVDRCHHAESGQNREDDLYPPESGQLQRLVEAMPARRFLSLFQCTNRFGVLHRKYHAYCRWGHLLLRTFCGFCSMMVTVLVRFWGETKRVSYPPAGLLLRDESAII
uniref:Uncharacterized protein n=1 Tax=Anopheles merus TaxID=30066 RepID=A0A182V383_ANOME